MARSGTAGWRSRLPAIVIAGSLGLIASLPVDAAGIRGLLDAPDGRPVATPVQLPGAAPCTVSSSTSVESLRAGPAASVTRGSTASGGDSAARVLGLIGGVLGAISGGGGGGASNPFGGSAGFADPFGGGGFGTGGNGKMAAFQAATGLFVGIAGMLEEERKREEEQRRLAQEALRAEHEAARSRVQDAIARRPAEPAPSGSVAIAMAGADNPWATGQPTTAMPVQTPAPVAGVTALPQAVAAAAPPQSPVQSSGASPVVSQSTSTRPAAIQPAGSGAACEEARFILSYCERVGAASCDQARAGVSAACSGFSVPPGRPGPVVASGTVAHPVPAASPREGVAIAALPPAPALPRTDEVAGEACADARFVVSVCRSNGVQDCGRVEAEAACACDGQCGAGTAVAGMGAAESGVEQPAAGTGRIVARPATPLPSGAPTPAGPDGVGTVAIRPAPASPMTGVDVDAENRRQLAAISALLGGTGAQVSGPAAAPEPQPASAARVAVLDAFDTDSSNRKQIELLASLGSGTRGFADRTGEMPDPCPGYANCMPVKRITCDDGTGGSVFLTWERSGILRRESSCS